MMDATELERLAEQQRRPTMDELLADDSHAAIYMIYGVKHVPHLIVSHVTLRQHWQGCVTIFAGDDAGEKAARAIAETHPRTQVVRFEMDTGKRGCGYLTKTKMMELSQHDKSIFIDADTVVLNPIEKLFPRADEIVLTQFANWTTRGRAMSKRIRRWEEHEQSLVRRSLSFGYPALNTGVIGFSPLNRRFGTRWREVTKKNIGHICDEIAAQLIFLDFPHYIETDKYNASAFHSWKQWLGKDVEHAEQHGTYRHAVIVHGHGNKFVTRPTARRIYWPHLRPLWEENFLGIRDYAKRVKRWKDYAQECTGSWEVQPGSK